MLSRTVLATILTALATGALAWWVKGDLEMAWLFFMLILPLAGGVIGLVAAFALRAPASIILTSATVIGPVVGGLALWAAMSTPHAWDAPGRARAERQAKSLAADVPRIETLARELLGAGVDVVGARPAVHGGRVYKKPLRFGLEREPTVAEVHVGFALGPKGGLTLRVDGDSLVAEPAALDSARAAPWQISSDALVRRFDARAVRLGASSAAAWPPGTLVPLRLEHADDDWSLLVLRVGGPDGLEIVRTISRDESRAALARAAARAGREVRDVLIYFTPNYRGVSFEPQATFDFIGLPVDRRRNLRLVARFRDGDFDYATMDWFEGR